MLAAVAANFGHADICKVLFDNDANIEEKNSDGDTAFTSAGYFRHADNIEALLDNGANITAKGYQDKPALC